MGIFKDWQVNKDCFAPNIELVELFNKDINLLLLVFAAFNCLQ